MLLNATDLSVAFFYGYEQGTIAVMKKIYTVPGICIAILFILLVTTQPSRLPSLMLVVPFVLLFTAIWYFSFSVFQGNNMTRLRSARLSLVLAGLPVSLLLLQSIGQLTVRDIVTIFAFFALAYFYISRLAISAD